MVKKADFKGAAVRAVAVALWAMGCTVAQAADGDAQQLARGKLLFTQQAVPACAVCHTLREAGSEGAVGPNLDELKPDANRVSTAMRNGLGNMPSFRDGLSPQDIEALARYVSTVAGR